MELVDFDTLKTILDLSGEESDYPDLTIIQESVVASFEDFTNRIFSEDKYTEQVILGDLITRMIPLPAIPISEVSSVLIDGRPTNNFDVTVYGIRMGYAMRNSTLNVQYKGGLTTVPKALERAALLETVYEYQNKNSMGLEVVSSDGGSVVKPEQGLLKEVKKLLESFIHPFPHF